jgi:mitogen-activated protein kinase kinase
VNGARPGGRAAPRLGLSIPGSAPPAINGGGAPALAGRPPGRGPPLLKLATPGNTANMGPPQHGRQGSISGSQVPQSAKSQYNALSFAIGLRKQVMGSPNTELDISGSGSAITENEEDYDSMDVEKLPVEGWKHAKQSDRIIELGSLGEGAGGAVTRCMLRGGTTVFALKVCSCPAFMRKLGWLANEGIGHNDRSNTRSPQTNLQRIELQQRMFLAIYLQVLRSIPGYHIGHNFHCYGVL